MATRQVRLTEDQRRERAINSAIGAASGRLNIKTDRERAALIGVKVPSYGYLKSISFLTHGLRDFCDMAKRLSFTDQEILDIVHGVSGKGERA